MPFVSCKSYRTTTYGLCSWAVASAFDRAAGRRPEKASGRRADHLDRDGPGGWARLQDHAGIAAGDLFEQDERPQVQVLATSLEDFLGLKRVMAFVPTRCVANALALSNLGTSARNGLSSASSISRVRRSSPTKSCAVVGVMAPVRPGEPASAAGSGNALIPPAENSAQRANGPRETYLTPTGFAGGHEQFVKDYLC